MPDLAFDRVVVITIERRRDRLDAFMERLPADWPWARPEVHVGVDGLEETKPAWWKTTPGAWGCYRSHHDVVRETLAAGLNSVLIFEDDCTFAPGFAEATAFIDTLPAGPCQIYLGGQHLRRPVDVSPTARRGTNVNRTHAYGLVGRAALELVDAWLADHPWKNRHHVDHRYGELHRDGRLLAWCPKRWICGQAAGTSDVANRRVQERLW